VVPRRERRPFFLQHMFGESRGVFLWQKITVGNLQEIPGKEYMKKVILAFSGGLDTSFSVPYLIEKGYEVITVTVDTGGFSALELADIAKKSKLLGATKHYQVDGKKILYDSIISYIIKSNGLYEGSYPNMCSDRYVIAQKALEIAEKENAGAVAHGCTAMGNDQVRFDLALMSMNPKTEIISPIKEMGGNRKEEQAYLAKKGFPVSSLHKKYSVNQNILGVTYSGGEIDTINEPDESMFLWTKKEKIGQEHIAIGFEHGLPVTLNGKAISGDTILTKLNMLCGSYGFGKGYYTGDCVIGIKGHIVFEAPGILTLLHAHHALEQIVLTKSQQIIGNAVSMQFTDLLYTGKFYDPAVGNLKAFLDDQQTCVTGIVTIKLEPNQIQAVSVKSDYSLIKPDVATYAQGCSWTREEADGFIKLFGLQSMIASEVHKTIQNKGKRI
jgi:argininosuccinate synthase